MASKYWIKLYHEILHDPKMARLPDRLWRRAIELFLMAGETGDGGELPPVADMAWTLRVETMELVDDLAELAKVGVLTETVDGWVVTKFAVRQAASSDAKRMAEWRERNRQKQYAGDASVTELVTNCNVEPDKNQRREEAEADKSNGGGSPLPDRDEYGPTNEPGGPTQMTSEEQKAVAKMWQDKMGSLCPPKILMYIGPEMRKYDGIHGHSALEWGLTVLEEAIAGTTNPMGPNEKYMAAIFANWNLNGWRAPPGQRESKRDEIADKREKAKATRQQMLAQGVPRAEVDATIVEFYGEGY